MYCVYILNLGKKFLYKIINQYKKNVQSRKQSWRGHGGVGDGGEELMAAARRRGLHDGFTKCDDNDHVTATSA